MAVTGDRFLTPSKIGINPNACTKEGTLNNFANTASALDNIQNQIGDLSQLNQYTSILGGPVTNLTNLTQLLSNLLQQLYSLISGGGGGPNSFKVKVNSADTPDYLEDQVRDGHVEASAQYTASKDLLVEVDTVDVAGDKLLRFFIDASDITNWDNTHDWVLGWTSATGNSQVFAYGLLKVDASQTLQYLGTAFELGATFASATDLKSYEQTVGSTPNKQIRLFTRFSDISGWNASNKQVLWNDGGTIKWMDAGSTAGTKTETLVTSVSFDEGTCEATVTDDSVRVFND